MKKSFELQISDCIFLFQKHDPQFKNDYHEMTIKSKVIVNFDKTIILYKNESPFRLR